MPQGTRHPMLEHLEPLVGEWETEATHQLLPDTVVRGRATFEWLEGGHFLIWRARNEHPDFPDSISILGCAAPGGPCASGDPGGGCTLRYFDSRGVSRLCVLGAEAGAGGSGVTGPASRSASPARSAPTATPSPAWPSCAGRHHLAGGPAHHLQAAKEATRCTIGRGPSIDPVGHVTAAGSSLVQTSRHLEGPIRGLERVLPHTSTGVGCPAWGAGLMPQEASAAS